MSQAGFLEHLLGLACALLRFLAVILRIYLRYCSPVTFSIHSTTLPSFFSCIAMCVMAVVGGRLRSGSPDFHSLNSFNDMSLYFCRQKHGHDTACARCISRQR